MLYRDTEAGQSRQYNSPIIEAGDSTPGAAAERETPLDRSGSRREPLSPTRPGPVAPRPELPSAPEPCLQW